MRRVQSGGQNNNQQTLDMLRCTLSLSNEVRDQRTLPQEHFEIHMPKNRDANGRERLRTGRKRGGHQG